MQTSREEEDNESKSEFPVWNWVPPTIQPESDESSYEFYENENFYIEEVIARTKCTIYKAFYKPNGRFYALKVFESDDNFLIDHYRNETRFKGLIHPNIVQFWTASDCVPLEAFEGEVGGKCIMFEYCPNGDFFDFVTSQPKLPEKIVRTYFHQLIQVIEYLHSSKIAHMDIKLENFLLDERFQLKLTDFDLALEFGEKPILKGTINYRAPEIISGECSDLSKVDIYSAGICLFLMLTGGSMPHIEDQNLDDGTNLFNLFARNKEEFWKKQCQLINVNHSFFSPSFRELFNMMTEVDPKKRATLDQIKSSEWYNDKILSHNELTFYFEN